MTDIKQTETRTQKSIRNTVIGVMGLIFQLVTSFISRSVFIAKLGIEYNGVNGLFTNILQTLNMAELGFASAIAFALYQPLKNGNEAAIAAIMNFFAKVYRIIALIVLIVGLCCIPFLQYLILEDISTLPFALSELQIYYVIFLANTVCSYLLAYKRTLIQADQNAYIISSVDYSSNIILNVLQIILLYCFRDYYVYLSIMIAKTIINNLILHLIAGKRYPFLKKYRNVKILKDDAKQIVQNVKALFLHRVGHVLVYNTSSIIVSAFIGIVASGKYANYVMITGNVWLFISVLFNSITASIGNIGVTEDFEKKWSIFKKTLYFSNFLVWFCLICYVSLFNDFINIWLGEEYEFSVIVVMMLSIYIVTSYLRKPILTFKDAFGLFKYDWYKPLVESAISIGCAIGLSYVWGITGIFIGYIIGTLFFAIPIENAVLFKHGFHLSIKKSVVYYLILLGVLCASAIFAVVLYFICTFIPDGIGWFILEFFFVVIFAAAAYLLLTCRTSEFKYYVGLAKQILRKVLRKKAAASSAAVAAGAENEGGSAEGQSDDNSESMEPSQGNGSTQNADLPQTDEVLKPVPEKAAQPDGAAEEQAGGAPDGKPQ